MKAICLIHWRVSEAKSEVSALRRAGYAVITAGKSLETLRSLGKRPLWAIVIDLSRLPKQGRDIALFLKQRKSTREVPIFFVGGDPAKVSDIRRTLPDAAYTTWPELPSDLRKAGDKPRLVSSKARSVMAGYAGVSLVKKLGIADGLLVGLVSSPRNFRRLLGKLPPGVTFTTRVGHKPDLIIWFARSTSELTSHIESIVPHVGSKGIWIAWPKKTSSLASDISQTEVRRVGLASGLVDYKVASIDKTWSGLKFALRRKTSSSH